MRRRRNPHDAGGDPCRLPDRELCLDDWSPVTAIVARTRMT
jgi:hypothetical protein